MRHDAPRDHLVVPFSGRPFERLGSGVTVGKSTLIVELSNLTGTADKTVVADAVYLVRKAPMSQSVYNSQGLLTATKDALGNQTTYAYDALGRMVKVTQPDPDGAGSLAAPVSSSHYNGAGQLTAAIAPDLSVSTFQYDTLGRQTAAYRGGLVHNRARAYAETGAWSDGSNQGLFDTERVATTVTDSATAAATWTFGGLTVGDDYGVFLTWTADAGNAEDASIKIYAGSTGTTPIWTETVDMTQPPGAARNSVLQPIDFAAKDFQRLDGVFTATAGTIIIELSNLSSTSGKKIVADTVYVVREDAVSQTVYDHAGRVWKTLDPEGYATTRTYDNLGRLVKITQPDPDNGGNNPALVVEYAYDAAGETTHVTETNAASSFARVSKTEYDAHGRVSRSVRIIGQDDDSSAETDDIVTAYGYDALGRMTSQTDPLNHATSYTFDNLGRKTRETNALSGQTDYAYDIAGRMTSLTDPEGNATRWAFGISGGVFTESINVNSADLVRTFEYNAAGNLTRKIDRNGRVIAYGYDHLLRQTSETWYDDVDDQTAKLTYTTAYNDLGQVASIGDGTTEYEYTYGLFGNLASTTQDLPGLTPDVKFAYRYDSSGRLAEVAAFIGPVADYVTTYTYDRIGRITRIEQDDAGGKPVAEKRVDFDYDAAGDLKEVKRYAELAAANLVARTDYVFDSIGRLTDLTHSRNQITLADYDLTWDAAGRITDFDFTSLIGNAGTAGYAYDNTDQLTAADYDFQTDESYSYDENGNRTNTGYSTGDHNRLSSDGTYNYTYDGEGNVTSKTKISDSTSIQYTWDHRNRLTKVTFKNSAGTATKIVEYCYDNGQRWIRKTLDTNADGTIEQSQIFVHDQGQIVLDFRKTGAEPATTLDLARRYLWGPAVDQLLADETVDDGTADDVAWVLGDHLNSVRDLAVYNPVTQMVSVVKHVTFDAFGNVTSDSAPGALTLFRYTARPYNADAGIQNNLNRWYDLSTARWMSADPIGFEAGDVNLYRYVRNGPVVVTDPLGLWELFDATGAIDQKNPTNPHSITLYDSRALYIAGRGDTFDSLLAEVNRRRDEEHKAQLSATNRFCVRPVPIGGYCGTGRPIATDEEMERAWRRGGPAPCGLYDARNLLDLLPVGGPVRAGVGGGNDNGYIENMGLFYGIPANMRHLSRAQIIEEIKRASGEGGTPIQFMTLIGHAARSNDLFGDQHGRAALMFGADDLAEGLVGPNGEPVGLYGQRAWRDAVEGRTPPIGWFRADKGTEVRFVGCESSVVARNFARRILRGDAVAWGTSELTEPRSGQTGARFVRDRGRLGPRPITDWALTPAQFEDDSPWSRYWAEWEGGQ